MIKLINIGKIYSTNNNISVGIRKVNLELQLGEFVAITGESGSGKSTLLNVISGIDSYEEGEMLVNGEETSYFNVDDLEEYRNNHVGFIFQNYNIIDSYTVLENVEAALLFLGLSKQERLEKALNLIERVGLKSKIKSKASKLSGGEKQRVVIARALAKDPDIIACDEPTGNLDSKSSKEIIDLIHEVGKGKLVLIVTHDYNEVKDYATRVLRIFDGEVKEDKIIKQPTLNEHYSSEHDNRKLKLKDLLHISYVDLFSSPRRFVFNFIVFLFMSILCMVVLGAYRIYNSRNLKQYNPYISNCDPARLVVNKRDGTSFTDSDYSFIDSISSVSRVEKYDVCLDDVLVFNSFLLGEYEEDVYFENYINRSSLLKQSDLAYGNLPINNNECVISVSSSDIRNAYDSIESFIGKDMSYNNFTVIDNAPKYKIVGVINQDSKGSEDTKYCYVTDAEYDKISFDSYTKSYLFATYVDKNNSGTNSQQITIRGLKVVDYLTDHEVMMYSAVELESVSFKDIYKTLLTITDVIAYTGDDYYTIGLSQNNYDAIKAAYQESSQISVFSSNPSQIQNIQKKLSENGYNAIIPYNLQIDSDEINKLLNFVLLIGIVQVFAYLFFIVFAILSHSIKSKREDVEILRTIGATKDYVKKMFIIEYCSIAIISYILSVIFFIALLLFTKGDFNIMIKSITFIDFIIYFFVVLIMSFLLSLMFTKSAFRKTVKKSLDSK